MRRTGIIATGVVAAALLAGVAASSARLAAARSQADAARARLGSIAADAAEVVRLRAAASTTAVGGPAEDATPRIAAALADSGLPRERLREVAPHNAAEHASGRAAVRVLLEPLALADVGRVLASLRASQRTWTPVQVEITGEHDGALRATLVLSAAVGKGN